MVVVAAVAAVAVVVVVVVVASPRVSFQCRLSHGVRTAPVCSLIHAPTAVRT